MPINVFRNSSKNNDDKIDTSLFVQKPYLRSNYIESNIEENIDLKNQNRIKNLPDPISIQEPASKNYVNKLFNDPKIVKNKAHIDLNDRNITNARFILQVNQLPQIDSHLTAKLYVNTEIDQPSLVRNNQDNDFGNYNLTNINSITLNKQAENDNEDITKAYVDQFHNDNERNRGDLVVKFYGESNDLVENNQDKDFNDNKLTNINSITINNNPTDDDHVKSKKFIDDELDKNTIVRFNQTLQNYLEVSVGSNTYNLTKNDKIHLTVITTIKIGNIGADLLPYWKIICSDVIINGKIANFLKATKSSSPTGDSGATSLPPIGNSFIYIETSAGNHGNKIFCSSERTDIIQITNITIYYNRFSILTNDSLKSMGRFRIQLLLEDNTWSTQYTIDKNSQYSDNSTDWTLLNLDFTVENYGIKIVYDEIDTPDADMCFSKITITHSVY